MQRLLLLLLALTGTFSLSAQSSFQFTDITANSANPDSKNRSFGHGCSTKGAHQGPPLNTRAASPTPASIYHFRTCEMLAYKVWDADLLPDQ